MDASDHFEYFRAKDQGQPLVDECLLVDPDFVVEDLLLASVAAALRYIGGDARKSYQIDSGYQTDVRLRCKINEILIFETYATGMVGRELFVAFAVCGGKAVATAIGTRDLRVNLSRVSGFPYLRSAKERAEEAFQVGRFDWTEAA